MSERLKNCPFCDGDDSEDNACQMAKVILRSFKAPDMTRAWRVECGCGAQGPAMRFAAGATKAWNTRHSGEPQTSGEQPMNVSRRIDRAKAIREERECSLQEAVAVEQYEFVTRQIAAVKSLEDVKAILQTLLNKQMAFSVTRPEREGQS